VLLVRFAGVVCIVGPQLRQAKGRPLAGSTERGRLLRQDLLTERVEQDIGGGSVFDAAGMRMDIVLTYVLARRATTGPRPPEKCLSGRPGFLQRAFLIEQEA